MSKTDKTQAQLVFRLWASKGKTSHMKEVRAGEEAGIQDGVSTTLGLSDLWRVGRSLHGRVRKALQLGLLATHLGGGDAFWGEVQMYKRTEYKQGPKRVWEQQNVVSDFSLDHRLKSEDAVLMHCLGHHFSIRSFVSIPYSVLVSVLYSFQPPHQLHSSAFSSLTCCTSCPQGARVYRSLCQKHSSFPDTLFCSHTPSISQLQLHPLWPLLHLPPAPAKIRFSFSHTSLQFFFIALELFLIVWLLLPISLTMEQSAKYWTVLLTTVFC